MNTEHRMELFACRASKDFAEKVVKELDAIKEPGSNPVYLGYSEVTSFSDGEFQPSFTESVRGATVFILQSTFPPADNLMELLLTIDAAKRASAYKVIAVMPYFGWARQDRKDKPRVSIGAKLVANLLCAAGVDRIMTCDLHADQIQGFFNVPVDHLYASSIFIPYINSLKLENMVIASPDVGGAKRANSYAKYFDVPLVLCHKTRAKANVIATMTVIGDVKDKNVILVDDIVDTAGTISKSANLLLENGAKSVRALCSHPVMSNPATERIIESGLNEIIFTDSIPYTKENPKATVLPVAKLFADTIRRIHNNQSISSQYLFK